MRPVKESICGFGGSRPSTQLHIPRSLPHEMFLQFPVTHAVIQNGGLSHDGPTEVCVLTSLVVLVVLSALKGLRVLN